MGLSKQKKNEELRELFVQAFADAKAKGKPGWRKMNLSVLKNRLLQRSDRRFREAEYGGTTMRELVDRFPDLLAIGEEREPSVSILVEMTDEELTEGKGHTTDDGGDAGGAEDEAAGFQAILDRYRTSGDNLGVGEAYASQLSSVDDDDVERTFVNIVTQWASSSPVHAEINTIGDLLEHVDKFVIDLLALAVVHATLRTADTGRELPARMGDVNYRVAEPLQSLFNLPAKSRPAATMRAATAKTKELSSALEKAVDSFCHSTAVAAKLPSTDIIKHAHAYALSPSSASTPCASKAFSQRRTVCTLGTRSNPHSRFTTGSDSKYPHDRIGHASLNPVISSASLATLDATPAHACC